MKNTVKLNSIGRLLLWVTIAAVAATSGRFSYAKLGRALAGSGYAHAHRLSDSTAYTIMRSETLTDNSVKTVVSAQYTTAVRSDGSRALLNDDHRIRMRFVRLTTGEDVRINETLGKKTTSMQSGPSRRPASCPDQSFAARGWSYVGDETIGGYRASKLELKSNSAYQTVWLGIDLGCEILQYYNKTETGLSVQNLVRVSLGEPDESLFEVPASLSEVSPSQLLLGDGPRSLSAPDQRRDAHYHDL